MIHETKGNLLDADAEALVNTVNTVGVMGKGVALQFKLAFPANFRAYEAACKRGEVNLGRMFVFRTQTLQYPHYILNFPTKRHWRGKSKFEYVETGLRDLIEVVEREKIKSIAIPPLGCGSGGLDWAKVKAIIIRTFSKAPNVKASIYAPAGAPAAEAMRIATERPGMTAGRAAILGLMRRYALPGYRLTLLEIQKLAYFMQVAGEPMRLAFEKQKYGPYTETLHHVLQRMEGHFISGYGDRSRKASIALKPDAIVEAEQFLKSEKGTLERFERVSRLIDGFETPYGMELLSSVHWVAANENPKAKTDASTALELVFSWNEHKRKTFQSNHVGLAWARLKEEGWF